MRILHVDTASSWRGGEQQVLYLLTGLARRGVLAELATPGDGVLAARARAADIPVHPFASRGDVDLGAAARLRKLIHRDTAALHLHTGHAHALGLLAVLGRPSPAIIVSRRVDFPVKGGDLGKLKYGRRVGRFIAVSDAVKGSLFRSGVPAERIDVVPSGVDPDRFAVPRDSAGLRRELGVPPSAKLVGFVGALVGHKAPGDLIEAMRHVPPDVHAVIAGEGKLAAELARHVRGWRLGERVHFLGQRDDVPRVLRSVDVFCLPSRAEGLGTSVLDAMAAGTPIVAAAGGGIPEVVESGRSGILVAPGEPGALAAALQRVLEDEALRYRLAAGGRERVRAFSVDRMVEGTIRVYEDVLGGLVSESSWVAGGSGAGKGPWEFKRAEITQETQKTQKTRIT